jgi:hypothetical protein
MNSKTTQQARPVHMPPKTEAEIEAEAIRDLERLSRALDRKRSGNKAKRRGGRHADRG